ncbi:hypothetical protein AgCh_022987 [Apium graveolens]
MDNKDNGKKAPVIFSQETVSYIESLDMMSGEEDCENILRDRSTGKAVLIRPLQLLDSDHLGVGPCGFYVHSSGFEKPLHDFVDALRQCYGDKQGKHYRIWVDQVFSTQVSSDIWIVRFKKWEISGSEISQVTARVMGTFGYVSPDYASTWMLNEGSDVYSFGVQLMEIITGRNPIDYSRAPGENDVLVFEAGKLVDNQIKWRGDSGLTDGKETGVDLSKGMYDVGDHMKFGYKIR